MKQVVLLCDGMADMPCDSLGGKNPHGGRAQAPRWMPWPGRLRWGLPGPSRTGWLPGSDVANLSVLGYNPQECYTGRSPLEAANLGIQLADRDVAMRCNLAQ